MFGFHATGTFGIVALLIEIQTVLGLVWMLFVKLNPSKGIVVNHLLGAVNLGYDRGVCCYRELPKTCHRHITGHF